MNGSAVGVRSFSLYELVGSVRRCLEAGFGGSYWVRAETSDVRRSGGQGHCYMELLEKSDTGNVRARIRASIWSSTYHYIDTKLRASGLASLSSGMSILALVQITYHEQYGLSLTITDIDPNYSLGELARLRQETIARLKRENVWDDNRSLTLPRPVQRLAIISSATAAGYGDFIDQLHGNRYGLQFYTALFSAQMQGDHTTTSILSALGRVLHSKEHFDAVVIIRGGGAVSELRAFDSYELCAGCAQFPFPILCGIGHERDESVLDLIAHTSLKTPTAVAEWLIHQMMEECALVEALRKRLSQAIGVHTHEWSRKLDMLSIRLPALAGRVLQLEHRRHSELRVLVAQVVRGYVLGERQRIAGALSLLRYMATNHIAQRGERLEQTIVRLANPLRLHRVRYGAELERYEQVIRMAHPDNVLRRGFALVYRDDRIITSADELCPGDNIRLKLGVSVAEATVNHVLREVTPLEGQTNSQ